MRRAMHPRGLRCSSRKYSWYSRSSRLAREAPRPYRCDAGLSRRTASRGRSHRVGRVVKPLRIAHITSEAFGFDTANGVPAGGLLRRARAGRSWPVSRRLLARRPRGACTRRRCRVGATDSQRSTCTIRPIDPGAAPFALFRTDAGGRRAGMASRHRALSLRPHTPECRAGGVSPSRRYSVLRDCARSVVSHGTAAPSLEKSCIQGCFRATLPERSSIHPSRKPS